MRLFRFFDLTCAKTSHEGAHRKRASSSFLTFPSLFFFSKTGNRALIKPFVSQPHIHGLLIRDLKAS